ncbi:MAG: hypothetical protein J7555_09720 [Chloroflexi bacterium]|nr:hypothetical protein [Chloroflexota bacterium]
MTTPAVSREILAQKEQALTSLQAEWRNFRLLLSRLLDFFMDSFFDLSSQGQVRRALIVGPLVLLVLFALLSLSIRQSSFPIQDLFNVLLNPLDIISGDRSLKLIWEFSLFFVKALALFGLAYVSALHVASIYQSDLFEFEDLSISRQFLTSAAFGGSTYTLHIAEGEVAERDRRSPIYLIGGPGWVQVAMDSAVLFEYPDGRPHVIGPTPLPVRLGAFERLREPVIDLRDQFLGSFTGEAERIRSRSRDGIPIEAHDVRFVFSIFRGGQNPTLQMPYPFQPSAVESLIYGLSSRVQDDERRPSALSTDWKATMRTMIRSELARFMSTHPLNEYLASIGAPEIQSMRNRATVLQENLREVDPDHPLPSSGSESAPRFASRTDLKSLFDRFASQFASNAHRRGVELRWLGLGTWKPPAGIVLQHHEEAWRLSRENLRRGSAEAIAQLEQEAKWEELMRRIQSVPLGTFHRYYGKETPRRVKRALLQEYCEQLKEARDALLKKDKITPLSGEEALWLQSLARTIQTLEGRAHFIGQTGPLSPPP